MKEELAKLIVRVARDQNVALSATPEDSTGQDIKLYGPGGVMDSLALVRLTVELEEAVLDRFGVAVTLANERAFSQRNSPFLTVDSLSAYIESLLAEAGDRQCQ